MEDLDHDHDPAARLVDALLTEGSEVDEGRFTLDPAAAAAKLAAFAYADRSVYLVPIVEGLIRLGAQRVDIDHSFEDLRIRASELELERPGPQLLDLYTYAIGSTEDPSARGLGRLAVGIDMVLGDAPKTQVELRYRGPNGAVVAEYQWRTAPVIREHEDHGFGELQLSIVPPLRALLRAPFDEALDQLRAAVQFSPALIVLDGLQISGQDRDWLETFTGRGPGYRFSAGLEHDEDQAQLSEIQLWSSGVLVERLPGPGGGFRAAIELEAPRRDLSQMKVVRDATVEHALAAVVLAHEQALAGLARADASWDALTRPRDWPPARVDRVLGREPRTNAEELDQRAIAREPVTTSALALRANAMVASSSGSSEAYGIGTGLVVLGGLVGLIGMAIGAPLIFAGVLIAGIGAAFMTPSRRLANAAIEAREQGTKVAATITKIVDGEESDTARVCWAFEDHLGDPRTGCSMLRSANEAKLWTPGEDIVVFYDPARPYNSWWEADIGPRHSKRRSLSR